MSLGFTTPLIFSHSIALGICNYNVSLIIRHVITVIIRHVVTCSLPCSNGTVIIWHGIALGICNLQSTCCYPNSPFNGRHLFSLISVWKKWEGDISAPSSCTHVYAGPDLFYWTMKTTMLWDWGLLYQASGVYPVPMDLEFTVVGLGLTLFIWAWSLPCS